MKKFLTLFLILFSTNIFAQNASRIEALKTAEEEIDDYEAEEFFEWVDDFKVEAEKKHKISKKTLDEAFKFVKYNPKVIKSDRRQPEFMSTFWKYHDRALNPERIANGKIMLKTYPTLLNNVSEKYGVQKEIIVAFWGLETNYGKILGKYNIIDSLATLAYDPRRSEFFKSELVNALKIIDDGHMKPENMVGSWAGAFGNFQFMPSTFKRYAVDGNGDGKINLTTDIRDAMHSAGNYLSKMGWKEGYLWGRPVKISNNNKQAWEYVNSYETKPLSFFNKLGVKKLNGSPVAISDIDANLIAPNGVEGPTFIIYDNFKYIMRWNASTNYALSVGLLSDALRSDSVTIFERPSDWNKSKTMTTNQIKQIQEKLEDLDLFSSKISGIYGKKTMRAIKDYQELLLDGDKSVSKSGKKITKYPSGNPVIPDGYPSFDLYEQMFEN